MLNMLVVCFLFLSTQLGSTSVLMSPTCIPHCTCSREQIDCTGSGYSSLPLQPSDRSDIKMRENNLTHLDLADLLRWPNLARLDLSLNRIKAVEGSEKELKIEVLDLSYNQIQVLHAFVFTQLPGLINLNISHNNIHTISQQSFHLPKLNILDLAFNNIEELPKDLVHSFGKIQKLYLSNNRLSRLTDESLSYLTEIEVLDFSRNFLMDIDENTLLGINITYLDLSFNSLRKIPTSALEKLNEVSTLILDGILLTSMETGAMEKVPVRFLSISHCPNLITLKQNSISSVNLLETLTLNNNPSLVYFNPGAVSSVPNLVALDITRNNLSALEDIQPYIPSLRSLFMKGNSLRCHCGLRWLQRNIQNNDSGFKIEDGKEIRCGEEKNLLSKMRPTDLNCKPFILPLFPSTWTGDVGQNFTHVCRSIGTTRTSVIWTLPGGATLRTGECLGRICVEDGILFLTCLHPQDEGVYSCSAENEIGRDTRSIQLHVKMLHIQIFPLTVADTFLTLSWNTSRSLSRDFVLRVESSLEDTPPMEFGNIEVGLKMSSYTISSLKPSQNYKITLCMKKGGFSIGVSSTLVRTKGENYMHGLGIMTDYTSIAVVSSILVLFCGSCIILSIFRLYKLRCLVDSDTMSTKPMMSSGSEPSSIAGISNITEKDRSRLMEHELTSPIEDIKTMESRT